MAGAAMIFYGTQQVRLNIGFIIFGFILLGLALAGGLFAMWYNAPGNANLYLLGAVFACGAIVGLGFPLLKAPSRSGRKIMDEIEGFREYLGVAEEDRLNALNPPEKTPELFEKFLPYAVALDCQNAWAAKFAGVLAAAGTAAAATAWYVGQPRLGQRSGLVRRSPQQRSVLDHRVVVDRAGFERWWQRRQQRRRLLGRRRRWWWRRRLVTGIHFP